MKLSIVTVCRNNLEGLKRTCESVWSQKRRDEIEHLVVDGASTDGTQEWLEANDDKFERWLSESDKGIYNAMNKALGLVSGDYTLFLNSGDEFASDDVVERCLPYLDGTTDIVYGDVMVVKPDEGTIKRWNYPESLSTWHFIGGTLCHQAVFIRTELHKENHYDERYRIVADYALLMRLIILEGRTTKKLPLAVCNYYLDGLSSVNKDRMMEEREIARRAVLPKILLRDMERLKELEELPYKRFNRVANKVRNKLWEIKRKIRG